MQNFLTQYADSVTTTLGLFWMAFWAFSLGYLISSMIQVFVTRQRMQQQMGEASFKSVSFATFFGFISSSCSFAALSGARTLFAKGAGFIPSITFLLASTNLVIELGIVIAIFLSWQFVVGEYLGGLLLILLSWGVIRLTLPKGLEKQARDIAEGTISEEDEGRNTNWKKLIQSQKGWAKVADRYVMEWAMVWKDVLIGFTVAGAIAVFVPTSFFESLFIGAGKANPSFYEVLAQAIIGPVAAFFTFIGSMGNIPLAAVLYGNGVAFAGIIAFIFSDLVVFPVLRIQAKFYGWKMALYILMVFLVVLVTAALIMHYGFAAFDLLPEGNTVGRVADREFFKVDYTMFFNVFFGAVGALMTLWHMKNKGFPKLNLDWSVSSVIMNLATFTAICWLAGGLVVKFLVL